MSALSGKPRVTGQSRLVLVSGPSCVGKTTFIEKLKIDSSLRCRLGFSDAPVWISDAGELRSLVKWNRSPFLVPCLYEAQGGHVFVTYDHNMLWIRGHTAYQEDCGLRELASLEDVVFVTMWEHPAVLQSRCDNRIKQLVMKLPRLKRLMKHLGRLGLHLRMRAFYALPSKVWRQYRGWFEFCDTCGATAHWTVQSTDPRTIVALAERAEPLWKQFTDKPPGSGFST